MLEIELYLNPAQGLYFKTYEDKVNFSIIKVIKITNTVTRIG